MAQRSGSADDFPYDESLQTRNLRGLDRLRAIPDRKLAEYLYQLHAQAVRNEAAQRDQKVRSAPHRKDHHQVAARALAGDLGPEALELATYLLLDDSGRRRNVSVHRDPRIVGEDRGTVVGAVHRSPARIWARARPAG